MRILIVNAFKDNEEGRKNFAFFEHSIQKVFSSDKHLSKFDLKLTSVDYTTIDEYLYEQYSPYTDKQSEKKFDYLDFIFIDGEPDLLPWYSRCSKFLLLLRMCKRSKKVLFAAGCGMLMQVYLCSNKYHITRVINGKGRGTSLDKLKALSEADLRSIKAGEVFLDSGTGDMYCYDNTTSEFCPVANIGFHHHKIAADMEFRQSILKPYKYQPRTFDFFDPVQAGKRSETVCRVLKHHVQHWLVKDIGLQDFLVSQKNSWDVHAVNVADVDSHFTILAESERSPQIFVQHNTAAVLFNIDSTYPFSVKVLHNFIGHMLKLYQQQQKLDVPLSSIPYTILPCKPVVVDEERCGSRPMTASTAKLRTAVYPDVERSGKETGKKMRPASSHSGFAISKRRAQPFVVQNNATRQEAIQVQPPKALETGDSLSVLESRPTASRIKGTFDVTSTVLGLRLANGLANTSGAEALWNKTQGIELGRIGSAKVQSSCEMDYGRTGSAKMQNDYQSELMRIINSHEEEEEVEQKMQWSKGEIRAMLHGLDGKNSERKVKKPKIKILYRSKHSKTQKNLDEKLFSTLNQKNKSIKYPFPGSVTSIEPYVDPYKVSIRQESKPKQWINTEGFSNVVRKSEEKPNAVYYGDPYNPLLHISSGKKTKTNGSKVLSN